MRVADEIVVDLIGKACGLSYTDAMADVERIDLGGIMVPVASPAALIRMKNTYRPQDRIDREYLEALIRRRGCRRHSAFGAPLFLQRLRPV